MNAIVKVGSDLAVAPGGIVWTEETAGAPVVSLGATLDLVASSDGPRRGRLTLASSLPGTITGLKIVWVAVDAPPVEWSADTSLLAAMKLGGGAFDLGPETEVLGDLAGSDPQQVYLLLQNASGWGVVRDLWAFNIPVVVPPVPLNVSAGPVLAGPITEGAAFSFTAPVATGDWTDVVYKLQPTEDPSSTNPGTESASFSATAGTAPFIAGAKDCFRVNAYFYGPGTSNPSGPYSSGSAQLTAAGTVTPVTLKTAAIVQENKVAIDGITVRSGIVVGAQIIAGSGGSAMSATIVGIEWGAGTTPATATLILGPITGGAGTIADNTTITGTNISCLANGASVAYGPTAGTQLYILPPTFNGIVTNEPHPVSFDIAADSSMAGATSFDLSGTIPQRFGTKYLRRNDDVAGAGISTTQRFSTTPVAIGVPTLAALADEQWPTIVTSEITAGTRVDYVYLLASLAATRAWWTTRSDAEITASPFPSGFEEMTLDGTINLTITTIAVDGMSGSAPVIGGLVTAGSKTAPILAYVAGATSGTGTIYAGALSSGSIADNDALTWAGGSGLANGASVSAAVSHQKWKVNATAGARDFSIFQPTTADNSRRTLFAITAEIGGAKTPLSSRKTVPYGAAVSTSDVARYINRSQDQDDDGEPGGCDMQFPRAFDCDGDYAIFSYDVIGPTETSDFGDNWQVEGNKGLWISQTTSGLCIDGDRVHGLFGAEFMRQIGTSYKDKEGLYYKSRATGQWKFVKALPNIFGSNTGVMRVNQRYIAMVAGSGSGPSTRTLYAIYAPSTTDSGYTTIQIYRTTDGGDNWDTFGGTLDTDTVGRPVGLWATADALYLNTLTGVWRRPVTAGASWTQATGLPTGSKLWLEKRGSTIYVSVTGVGLYTATDATTLAFTQKKSYNIRMFSVSPVNSDRIVLVPSPNNVTPIGTGDGGATWFNIAQQPYPGQPNDFAHKVYGSPAWVMWHKTDPDVAMVMRFQHPGRFSFPDRTFYWASRNMDYSEIRSIAFHSTDPLRLFMGMTDRCYIASDHGARFVMDDAISDADKATIKSYFTDPPGALTARGVLMLERGSRTGYVGELGLNGQGKVSVAVGRSVTTARTQQTAQNGTPGTGDGSVTVVASNDLPCGKYVLTCTAAAANGGTFTGVGPLGIDLGTWTVGTARTFTHPRGGTLAVTISDGSTDFTAGSSPCVITITVNPIGGARKIVNPTTKDTAYFSQTNPAVSYRGICGRHVYEMDESGDISITATLTQAFVGYWGRSGDIVLCYSNGANATLWRGTGESAAGVTLSSWATNVGNVAIRGTMPALIASSHDDQRAYAGLNNGKLVKVQNGAKTTIFDIDAWWTAQGITGGDWAGSAVVNGRNVPMVSGVAESWFDPNLLYVSMYHFGGDYCLFGTENALDATPIWVNITRDAAGRGLVQPIQNMTIHPLTDEPFLFSAHGTVMVRPKEAHRIAHGITSSLIDHLRAGPGGSYHSTQPI